MFAPTPLLQCCSLAAAPTHYCTVHVLSVSPIAQRGVQLSEQEDSSSLENHRRSLFLRSHRELVFFERKGGSVELQFGTVISFRQPGR